MNNNENISTGIAKGFFKIVGILFLIGLGIFIIMIIILACLGAF